MVKFRPERLLAAQEWLAHYERFWTSRLDALQEHLERTENPGRERKSMTTLATERVKVAAGSGEGASASLEMKRVIRASRARVYEAWTRAEVLREWFGPGDMVTPNASLDVREGGEYSIEMRGPAAACDGGAAGTATSREALVKGVYREVVPNERLKFTWCGNWDEGETSVVTVSFRDVEEGTELTLRHERFATEVSRDKHEHGWGASLPKLVRVLEQ